VQNSVNERVIVIRVYLRNKPAWKIFNSVFHMETMFHNCNLKLIKARTEVFIILVEVIVAKLRSCN
jgi:hypothetical protein